MPAVRALLTSQYRMLDAASVEAPVSRLARPTCSVR